MKNPEAFTHDLDGNLTSDGRWTYEWNAENQLAAMQTRPHLPATLERQRLEFTYDYASRRIRKQVFQWDGTEFAPTSDTWFLYHGWKLLAEGTIRSGWNNKELNMDHRLIDNHVAPELSNKIINFFEDEFK